MRYFLADVNVWLATLVAEHPHHDEAVRWWRDELLPARNKIAFCRITQLGLLRLLTNKRVMGAQTKKVSEAWALYERVASQLPVVFAPEPEGVEQFLAEQSSRADIPARLWTDSYLAAFARSADLGLVTFDRDFKRFPGLDLSLLSPKA